MVWAIRARQLLAVVAAIVVKAVVAGTDEGLAYSCG